MQWHFREKRTGDDFSDPISGEFFADGSIDNPATALVAEALQNALDAGRGVDRGGRPVRVRLALRRGDYALPGDVAERWFGDLRPHLTGDGSGIRDVPGVGEPCDLLVIEDFGTCGLTGDLHSDDAGAAGNHFVDFMRSDGRTHKAAGDRGSWGVGKIVFPRSSRINGFLVYTVRRDDGLKLAMGKVILKNRRVAGRQYQPPCYFAASWPDGGVPLPGEDPDTIERLRSTFGITRRDEPGLSIVVPWVDPEIGLAAMLAAVVERYAYAILAGQLAVTLDDGVSSLELDAASLPSHTDALTDEDAAAVRLAAWSLGVDDHERVVLAAPPAAGRQQWDPALLSEGDRQRIKAALAARERVAVRFPLHVPEAGARRVVPGHFDVYLEHHDGGSLRPRFVRECLAIARVGGLSASARLRSLVVVGPGPLADLLGAAEPPSHSDWASNTANFRQRYKGRTDILTYVKKAVQQLIAAVRAGGEKPDPTVTVDFFAVVEPGARTPTETKKRPAGEGGGDGEDNGEDGGGVKPPDPDPTSSPRRVSIDEVRGGFVVRPGDAEARRYGRLDLRMAYDVFIGSPWSKYEPADFDLTGPDRSGIEVAAAGDAEFRVLGPNRLRLDLTGDDYEVYVTGFDTNRDLKVKAVEAADDDEPAAAEGAPEDA